MHELRKTRSFGKRSYQNRWTEGELERGSLNVYEGHSPFYYYNFYYCYFSMSSFQADSYWAPCPPVQILAHLHYFIILEITQILLLADVNSKE